MFGSYSSNTNKNVVVKKESIFDKTDEKANYAHVWDKIDKEIEQQYNEHHKHNIYKSKMSGKKALSKIHKQVQKMLVKMNGAFNKATNKVNIKNLNLNEQI